MPSILLIKAIAAVLTLAALTAALWALERHVEGLGAAKVQARWDKDLAERTEKALAASETNRLRELAARIEVGKVDHELQAQKVLRVAADKRSSDSLQRLNAALASGGKSTSDIASAGGTDGDPRDGIIANCADSYRRLESATRIVESQVAGLQSYATKVCVTGP